MRKSKPLYIINGIIIHGRHGGKKLGFPTANIKPDKEIVMPKHGIYAGKIIIDRPQYKGREFLTSCSVGTAKMFGAIRPTIEAYIIDFDDDIYGQRVELQLLRYIRGMLRFDSAQDLIERIAKDVEKTCELLR